MAEYFWTAGYRAALDADPQFLLESARVALEDLQERRREIDYLAGSNLAEQAELRCLVCALSDLHIVKAAFLSNNPAIQKSQLKRKRTVNDQHSLQPAHQYD